VIQKHLVIIPPESVMNFSLNFEPWGSIDDVTQILNDSDFILPLFVVLPLWILVN
jgi:hypothetical protein